MALGRAYPCTKEQPSKVIEAVEMKHLRPNMNKFVGKTIRTSGFIKCIFSIEDCTVDSTSLEKTLSPYLYFDVNALTADRKTEFYTKCRELCFFEGLVLVKEHYGNVRLQPKQVTFDNSLENLRP